MAGEGLPYLADDIGGDLGDQLTADTDDVRVLIPREVVHGRAVG